MRKFASWTVNPDDAVTVANKKAWDLLVEVQDTHPDAQLMPVDGASDCCHRYIVLPHLGDREELWFFTRFRFKEA